MRDTLDTLNALADENRLRILCALRESELCACQIIALLDLAPSTVSKHLSVLRMARLVDSRKNGRWMHYRLSRKFRTPSAARILDLLFDELRHTGRIVKDRRRIKTVCKENIESLCRRLFCKTQP